MTLESRMASQVAVQSCSDHQLQPALKPSKWVSEMTKMVTSLGIGASRVWKAHNGPLLQELPPCHS